ncbi:MAG: hypothetical protein V4534_06385 [Myxococcota bacterium]
MHFGKLLITTALIFSTASFSMPLGYKIGGGIFTAGAIGLIVGGIIAGVTDKEEYCDPASRFKDKVVVGTHDCSYQTCAVQSCSSNGKTNSCHCSYYRTVDRTCNDYGCQDPNTGDKANILTRHVEPHYSNALIAVYVHAGVAGLGLLTILGTYIRLRV